MKSVSKRRVIVFFPLIVVLQSCGINNNWMWKEPKDWDKYADEKTLIDTNNVTKDEYRIDVNDIFQMRFFVNDGLKILDITTANEGGGNQGQLFSQNNTINYFVQKDSTVHLPTLGVVKLVGKTIREAELYLQDEYNDLYVDAFVQLTVTNRRVIVFPGNGGQAQVLYLANNNTTLGEVIALAGGITERGRASRVKLIRKGATGREVYRINLATVDNVNYADVVVRANDYIYVEPVPQIGREILAEVTPIVSLITSAAVIISVIAALK